MVQPHASSDPICQMNDLVYEADVILESYNELSLKEKCVNAWVRIKSIIFINCAKGELIEALRNDDIDKQNLWRWPLEKSIKEYDAIYS